MNFSQVIKQGDVVLELKYCERCGGLWLRCPGDEESYCENCRAAMVAWTQLGKRIGRRNSGGSRTDKRRQRNVFGSIASEHCVVETLCGVAEQPAGSVECECISDLPEVRV